jgi:SAM-dependent methyltransferase
MEGVSPSGSTPPPVMALLFAILPPGLCLNLGSGSTSSSGCRADQSVVNCDVAAPRASVASFSVADAQHLPFSDGSFTGVLAKDVLEHVEDVGAALRELHRVTAPHSILALTVPRAIPRAVWADPTHRRGFTATAIETALHGNGWARTSRRRFGGLPGAGRLRLERHLVTLLRIPVLGHRFGTNWLVCALRSA